MNVVLKLLKRLTINISREKTTLFKNRKTTILRRTPTLRTLTLMMSPMRKIPTRE